MQQPILAENVPEEHLSVIEEESDRVSRHNSESSFAAISNTDTTTDQHAQLLLSQDDENSADTGVENFLERRTHIEPLLLQGSVHPVNDTSGIIISARSFSTADHMNYESQSSVESDHSNMDRIRVMIDVIKTIL